MSSFIDLTGKRFGRLAIVGRAKNTGKRTAWYCICDCGNKRVILSTNLIDGKTLSCGCLRGERTKNANRKHGLRNSRLYTIWINMKQRCYNPKNTKYEIYGKRGISICSQWLNNFMIFFDWAVSNGYADDLTIDRKNVNGNYEPSNCRWITNQEQQRNRRNTRKYKEAGVIE